MIHHVNLHVADLERSASFYDAVLGALGWRRLTKGRSVIGYGLVSDPVLFLTANGRPAPGGGHVCFAATGTPAVKAAWEIGLRAGGSDDGPPALRNGHGPSQYSAFLRDPDGHRVAIAVRSA